MPVNVLQQFLQIVTNFDNLCTKLNELYTSQYQMSHLTMDVQTRYLRKIRKQRFLHEH